MGTVEETAEVLMSDGVASVVANVCTLIGYMAVALAAFIIIRAFYLGLGPSQIRDRAWPRRLTMMKRLRTRHWLLASIVVIGLILLWLRPDQPPVARKDWLAASTPTFGSRTNADGICVTVSFTVSNAGPRKLDFGIAWYECRAKSSLSVLATSVQTHTNGGGYVYGMFGDGPPTPLSPGATCIVTRDLSLGASTNEARLFCCEIGWIGHEPKLSGPRFDDFMVWTLNIFNIDWKRRWRLKPSTLGAVFTSNIEAADYFQFVYGVEGNNGTFPIHAPAAYVEIAAEMAFTSFCRQSPNARN